MADNRPFVGIKILEVSRVLASPFAGYQLGLLGADVIKIEDPVVGGDTMRHRGRGNMPQLGKRGMHTGFMSVNANKRSLTLNLREAEGQEIFRKLAKDADVIIENLRTGAMDGYGLGYEHLRVVNPGIIYCSITGYGQTGPEEATSRLRFCRSGSKRHDEHKRHPRNSAIEDRYAINRLWSGVRRAVIGIISALFHRHRTGVGQHVDTSLLDAALALMGYTLTDVLTAGAVPRPQGNSFGRDAPTNRCFATQDGLIAVAVNEQHQLRHFMEAIGRPDILSDPRLSTEDVRRDNFEILREQIESGMLKKTAQEWEDILNEAGVPAMRVTTIPEMLKHPQVASREMFHTFDAVPGIDIPVTIPMAPFRMSVGGAKIDRPPPLLGAHTTEILENLGYDVPQLEALRQRGVI